jgi:hypothetical protein
LPTLPEFGGSLALAQSLTKQLFSDFFGGALFPFGQVRNNKVKV